MSKKNPFTRQQGQEVQLHANKYRPKEIVKRSFSLYKTDYDSLGEMSDYLSKFTNQRMSNSLVIRTALNHLRTTIENGGQRAEEILKERLRESI